MVLDYEIIRNLHLKLSAGVDFNQQNQNIFKPKALDPTYHFSTSEGTIARDISLINENLLSYNFSIKNRHNFDVLWDFLSRKTRVSTIKVRVPTDRTITFTTSARRAGVAITV